MDRVRRTQESYDRIAAEYWQRHDDRSALYSWMKKFAAQVAPCGRVLDLGAGPCVDSADLRGFGLDVISLDRSRQMLSVARERHPGLRVQGDSRHLPFPRASIDGVWASASLLHLERADLGPALAGIRDVLRPGGVLFLTLKEGAGEGWEIAKYGADTPRWFTYWSEREVDGLLEAAELDLVESSTEPGRPERWIVRLARRRPA